MKLKRTDINYLGVGLNEYPIEEVRHFFGEEEEVPIEEFVKELLYVNNRPRGFKVGCASADYLPVRCPFEVVMDIGRALSYLYEELKPICGFVDFDDDIEDIEEKNYQYKEPFKIILEGMARLREKEINTFGTHSISKVYLVSDGEEIQDEVLWQYGYSKKGINAILKERNIERLKKLFEEDKTYSGNKGFEG